jgi:hypothetical protein
LNRLCYHWRSVPPCAKNLPAISFGFTRTLAIVFDSLKLSNLICSRELYHFDLSKNYLPTITLDEILKKLLTQLGCGEHVEMTWE